MKRIINLVALAIVVVAGISINTGGCGGLVTSKEFTNHRIEFRLEMDSLHYQIDSVSKVLELVKEDTDSLKNGQLYLQQGQKLIFDKIPKEKSNQNYGGFFDKLMEFGK